MQTPLAASGVEDGTYRCIRHSNYRILGPPPCRAPDSELQRSLPEARPKRTSLLRFAVHLSVADVSLVTRHHHHGHQHTSTPAHQGSLGQRFLLARPSKTFHHRLPSSASVLLRNAVPRQLSLLHPSPTADTTRSNSLLSRR